MHYSVPESAGIVALTILKKNQNEDFKFGVRTIEVKDDYGRVTGKGTAIPEKDYEPFDRNDFVMSKRETEKTIEIIVRDNEDVNPDLDLFVEIYDPTTDERFDGDDTECKITILDEDFPGKLSFFMTEVQASKT